MLLLTATMTTMVLDYKSEDGAWDNPHCCWIRCHDKWRTIKATEEAEDNPITPLAATTGEEKAIQIPCWHC